MEAAPIAAEMVMQHEAPMKNKSDNTKQVLYSDEPMKVFPLLPPGTHSGNVHCATPSMDARVFDGCDIYGAAQARHARGIDQCSAGPMISWPLNVHNSYFAHNRCSTKDPWPRETDHYHDSSATPCTGQVGHRGSNNVCAGSSDGVEPWDTSKVLLISNARTSVMMRNIPNNMTRDTLVELLDANGFAGCYDFVYLPTDFHTEAGLGYAFINLFGQDEAERLLQHFEGFTGWGSVSEKVCRMTWSDLDGLQGHVDRYRNSPVQHESIPDKVKPAMFNTDGERVAFPAPTKRIRPPRFKLLAAKLANVQ
jgi:hypothetical protein